MRCTTDTYYCCEDARARDRYLSDGECLHACKQILVSEDFPRPSAYLPALGCAGLAVVDFLFDGLHAYMQAGGKRFPLRFSEIRERFLVKLE